MPSPRTPYSQASYLGNSVTKRFVPRLPETWPVWLVTLLSALVLTVFYNQAFYRGLALHVDGIRMQVWLGFSVLLFLLNHLIIVLLAGRRTLKLWLITLLFLAALSSYFMPRYGVMIDREMLQNALETDIYEIQGLLDTQLLWHLLLFFVLPAWLIGKLPIRWAVQWQRRGATWLSLTVITIMLISGLLINQYQLFSSVFRNYREVKHLATPFNSLDAMGSLVLKKVSEHPVEFRPLALDVHIRSQSAKPDLIVIVVGETARADHFSLNGYNRNTTPALISRSKLDPYGTLINFSNVSACGTATAVSVPCLFSPFNREGYSKHLAQNTDNVLDIAQRAGIETLWIDNNSGCKGVCDRIPTRSVRACPEGNCSDLELVKALRKTLLTDNGRSSRLVVLHQLGSHGPEYFKRSLPAQKAFLPECQTNQFQSCERQSIINAYDNSILATDAMLDATISLLEEVQDDYNTALLYVSDHGESLGENGVFLHGLPYAIAPQSQKHVAMLMWLSNGYTHSHSINMTCLAGQANQTVSHDDIFPVVIEMMGLESNELIAMQTNLSQCLKSSEAGQPDSYY